MHYDTFPTIKTDHVEATDKFKSSGKSLILIPIGDSIVL